MSEIPYFFETPVPKYFREKGWFDDENTFKFVTWAFSRCSTRPHIIVMDKKEVTLAPFEFVAGRLSCPQECYLTEKKFRVQLKSMIDAGLLKKGANSKANRFTTYIWVTERFSKYEVQQNGQQRSNRGPTEGHNQEEENIRSKESHHPYPSSKVVALATPEKTDDFFQIEKEKAKQGLGKNASNNFLHNSNYQDVEKTSTAKIKFVFTVNGAKKIVELSPQDFEACLKMKGSREAVEAAIGHILSSPGRKYKISNWPNALATWDIKTNLKPRVNENEEIALRLSTTYDSFEKGNGHTCRVYMDKQKDQRGLLFEPQSPYLQPVFIALVDADFKGKVCKYLRSNKMQKSRVSANA